MPCPNGTVNQKLWIRTGPSTGPTADTGVRPYTHPWWISPDITLELLAALPGGAVADGGTTAPGVPTQVRVAYRNNSPDTVDEIGVEAWVCDPATGIHPSTPLAGTARLLGTTTTPLGPSPSSGNVLCKPTAVAAWTDVVDLGGTTGRAWSPGAPGHFCLIANAYATNPTDDGSAFGGAPATTREFRPYCNSHHAQRNITVLNSDGTQPAKAAMKFKAWNQGKAGELFQLQAIPVPTRLLGIAERRMLRALAATTGLRLRRLRAGSRVVLSGEGVEGFAASVAVEIPSRKARDMQVEVFLGKVPDGTYTAFDVVQSTESGLVVGGLRALAVATPRPRRRT